MKHTMWNILARELDVAVYNLVWSAESSLTDASPSLRNERRLQANGYLDAISRVCAELKEFPPQPDQHVPDARRWEYGLARELDAIQKSAAALLATAKSLGDVLRRPCPAEGDAVIAWGEENAIAWQTWHSTRDRLNGPQGAQERLRQVLHNAAPPNAPVEPTPGPATPASAELPPEGSQQPDPKPASRPRSAKGKNVNARMLAMMGDRPESVHWTAEEWARELTCAKSSIVSTPTWLETLAAAKAMAQLDQKKRVDRRRRPRRSRRA
jgi:hypothetical protein